MAIYHLSVKTISRSAGRSATAAIAYRSGEKVADERTGLVHDYTRRRGIEHTEIFLPENSPTWASDRTALWNAAEHAEKRKNSTVAREFEVAIPEELNKAQRLELVGEFARDLVQRHGMAVDVALHEPGKEGDKRNHHAHILCTTRRLTPEGFKDKTRELDDRKTGEVEHWRARWAEIANHHLERAGVDARIDHRSLEAQGSELVAKVHLGHNVVHMERRKGILTDRGNLNRKIEQHNAKIIDFAKERERILREREVQHAEREKDPAQIKREWSAELQRQIATQTEAQAPVVKEAEKQFVLWRETRLQLAASRPRAPQGLLAIFKQRQYETDLKEWKEKGENCSQKIEEARAAVAAAKEYLPSNNGPSTKGDLVAENNAKAANPELSEQYKNIIEREKAEKEKAEQQRKAQQEAAREKVIQEVKVKLAEQAAKEQAMKSGKYKKMAETFATETPTEAVKKYPELAGAVAAVVMLDKKAEADGLSPPQRAIIAARIRQNIANSIERGNIPEVKLKEEVKIEREADQGYGR